MQIADGCKIRRWRRYGRIWRAITEETAAADMYIYIYIYIGCKAAAVVSVVGRANGMAASWWRL